MRLSVLTENNAGPGYLAEHGLSYFIEYQGNCVLFDTGHTDVFLKNAHGLGFDIVKEVDTIILSHGHWDHGNGLRFLSNKKLITHPGSFIKRYRKKDGSSLGLCLNETEIRRRFELKLTKVPLEIYPGFFFLGEIPRLHDFESKTTDFVDAHMQEDYVLDDSAIAVVDQGELIIVTACSHAGICNIISYAMQVTGVSKVKALVGGFHLKYKNQQTQKTIDFMLELGIKTVCPSHCTSVEALAAFRERMPVVSVKTGMVFVF